MALNFVSCFDGDRLRVPAAICPRCAWPWESRIVHTWGSRRNPARRLSAAAPSWFLRRRWGHLGPTRAGAVPPWALGAERAGTTSRT